MAPISARPRRWADAASLEPRAGDRLLRKSGIVAEAATDDKMVGVAQVIVSEAFAPALRAGVR